MNNYTILNALSAKYMALSTLKKSNDAVKQAIALKLLNEAEKVLKGSK